MSAENLDYGVPPGLILDPPPFNGSRMCYTVFHFGAVRYVVLLELNQIGARPPEHEIVRVLEEFKAILTDEDILYVVCQTKSPFINDDLGRKTIPADIRVLYFPSESARAAGIGPLCYEYGYEYESPVD